MDPASDTPHRPQRASSSEPGSSRANPFDDTDASSRKRRRTTASSSPVLAPRKEAAVGSSSSIATDATVAAASVSPSAVSELHELPLAPRTPEHQITSMDSTSRPPSSKVTINLRNAPLDDTMSLSSSPSTQSEGALAEELADRISGPDQPRKSVELIEASMSQTRGDPPDSSTPSSLDSATPPMELLVELDEDNDMISDDELNGDGSLADGDQLGDDPINRFPFMEPGDTVFETVNNLVNFLSSQTTVVQKDVIDKLAFWIERYLAFAAKIDRTAALETCRANRNFWITFPDVLYAMLSKRPSLHTVETTRRSIMRLYTAFVQLAAGFVGVDCITLAPFRSRPSSSPSQSRGPELYSFTYLHHIHLLLQRDESDFDAARPINSTATSSALDDSSIFISKFLTVPSGDLRSLGNLATGLIELIPTYPKITTNLSAVCQIVEDVLRESRRVVHLGQQGVLQARANLERGHNLWITLSTALLNIVEKHVTSLNHEATASQIQALTEILKLCLHSNHKLAATTTSFHQQKYPGLSHDYTPDAIAWEWRFDILDKLIRSSQMQLRVMGVTTMCSELVCIWKRLSEGGDEAGASFLRHIGDYLLDNNIIDYILSPNCHPEIIVESANIVGFLVVTKLYRPEHTDQLWRGIVSNQNPRAAEAVTRMVATVASLLDLPFLIGFCQKLQNLPIEAFSPAVRTLWENVMRQMVARSNAQQLTLTFDPYELCLRLLREASVCASGSQVAYPEIQHAAMQKFKELLSYGPDPEGRTMLYRSCIDDISARSPTTLGSLSCLSMAIRPGLAGELSLLTEQHDLARLIVEELEHAVVSGQAAGVPTVLAGGPNAPRRDFITNIMHLQPASITNQLGDRLWDILVGPQSPSHDDRHAGWQILISVHKQVSLKNSFLQAAFSRYLPALPPACFCEGMHGFIREHVLSLVDNTSDFVFDDENEVANSGIEQLWRITIEADTESIANMAIRTLACEVYIESKSIKAYPFQRARQVHLSLVNRCLRQLGEAARRIRSSSEGSSSGDDESMVLVPTDDETRKQERIFTRSLKLLRFFLQRHQSKPSFAAPDLRSLMSRAPQEIKGDLAQLKYQSFDGPHTADVRPLSIGKLNTAASLLASLKRETGFPNYRVYYRGRLFHPSESDICRSLEDLQIHEGLMLVKREEEGATEPVRIRRGSSSLEIEILSHFEEMWEYLSMDTDLAKEIYDFLVKLPGEGHIIELFENSAVSHRDMFPPAQPFKSLYAVHTMSEHVETNRQAAMSGEASLEAFARVLTRSASLILQAMSDEAVLHQASKQLQMKVTGSLMHAIVRLLELMHSFKVPFSIDSTGGSATDRFVGILSNAAGDSDPEASELALSTFIAICRIGLADSRFWDSIMSNQNFIDTIHWCSLFDKRELFRKEVLQVIEETLQEEDQVASADSPDDMDCNSSSSRPLTRFFWSVASDTISKTNEVPHQSEAFFAVFQSMLFLVASKVPGAVDLKKLASQASYVLLNNSSIERIGKVPKDDPIVSGFTSILQTCLQMDDSLPTSGAFPGLLARELFNTHLFPRKRNSHDISPVQTVVLNTETRGKLCEIIFRLVRYDRREFNAMLKALNFLVPYYTDDEADDPYLYELPFQFDRLKAIRNPCGYVGLRNLSNTCYLNSLLTQLFMNTGFRRFVLASKPQESTEPQLLYLTQKLFAFLQDSYRRYVDPSELVCSIKTYDDAPIDIHSQMDVDEFYNLLFDRWEGQLTTGHDRKKLRSFYGGHLVQQVKSKECDHISERLEPFSAIQCDIKGKTTLQESLQAYVDGEIMEGENKYKCSTCDRHVDAVKRACLKDLPDNLIFHLKRFDFNLRTLQRSKINDYFSFPDKIDLNPYTIEYLSDTSSGEKTDIFELVGILVHSGTAESGHYYSYVKERPTTDGRNGWVEFNDDVVTPWDPKNIPASTYGGPDHRSAYETNGILYDKSYSAYMLFYQRVSSLDAEQQAMSDEGISAPVRCDMARELKEFISGENTVLLRRHCLYDPAHAIFVQNMFSQAKMLEEEENAALERRQDNHNALSIRGTPSHGPTDLAMEMAMSHLDQVVSRTKDLHYFSLFSSKIESAVMGCAYCALAYYDYFFLRRGALRAMLQRNPEQVVRTFIGRLFLNALKKISADLPEVYASGTSLSNSGRDERDEERGNHRPDRETPVIEGAMVLINYLWRFFQGHIRAWDEYFGIILAFAKSGHQEAACLLANDYLNRLMRIIAADETMGLPQNYLRMIQNVARRLNSKPPSYTWIIAAIDYLLEQLEPTIGPNTIVDAEEERLEQVGPPFYWTSDEVQLVHFPDDNIASLFVEKLVVIDQAREATWKIVARLVRTSPQMDQKVYHTVRKGLHGLTSTQAMDPFLRVAGAYLESTRSEQLARMLIGYVSDQARHLQSTEGLAFVQFFKTAVALRRPEQQFKEYVHRCSLQAIPDWAPHLLVDGESRIRVETHNFLDAMVLRHAPGSDMERADDEVVAVEGEDFITELGQKLSIKCLVYLRDTYVKRRAQIPQYAFDSIVWAAQACEPFFGPAGETRFGAEDIDFASFQAGIIEDAQALIVDEEDDLVSESWNGSGASSDQVHDIAELSMHAIKEMVDTDPV